jgi:transcription elongation factor Elf1
MQIKKDKFHCPIYHLPKDFVCPTCNGWNSIDKPVREHFEKYGAAGVECGQCGAVKFWYKIPDPREPKIRRAKQAYYKPEEYE